MDRLILFTKEQFFPGESEIVNRMLSSGNFSLHLRKKDAEERDQRKFLLRISPQFHPRIVIHQHYQHSKEFPLGGIHLPEKERINFTTHQQSGYRIISTSIHLLSDYADLKKDFQYIFYSPVFPSVSKEGYSPAVSDDQLLSEMNSLQDKQRLVALGGITPENFASLQDYGFTGAGILGSVWESKNPEKTLQEFLRLAKGESR